MNQTTEVIKLFAGIPIQYLINWGIFSGIYFFLVMVLLALFSDDDGNKYIGSGKLWLIFFFIWICLTLWIIIGQPIVLGLK